jgi:hypothetical protein
MDIVYAAVRYVKALKNVPTVQDILLSFFITPSR